MGINVDITERKRMERGKPGFGAEIAPGDLLNFTEGVGIATDNTGG